MRPLRVKQAEAGLKGKLQSAGQQLRRLLRSNMVLLMLGGALGTYLRYVIGRWFNNQPWGQTFPYGTLFVNVSGSFILGAAAVIILEGLTPEYQDWYLLVGTGFCGGYTTFSTFEWETFRLVRDGSWGLALANVLGSVLAGFVGVFLAVYLASKLFPRL
jgi:CrcB protein